MLTSILLVSFLFKRTEAVKPNYQFLFVDSLVFFCLQIYRTNLSGDSDENCSVCPIYNVLKTALASSQSGTIIIFFPKWKFVYYYRSGNNNIC